MKRGQWRGSKKKKRDKETKKNEDMQHICIKEVLMAYKKDHNQSQQLRNCTGFKARRCGQK